MYPLVCLDNWEECSANWYVPVHGQVSNPHYSQGYQGGVIGAGNNNNTLPLPFECPQGMTKYNGRCVPSDGINDPVINFGITPSIDILGKLKAAAASNPLLVYGGLGLLAYLVIKK